MNKYDLPLKIVHGFDFPESMTKEEITDKIATRLQSLKDKGFGGIVTNAAHRDYLQNTHLWNILLLVVEQASLLDMRVWLYDEDGYPSGAAGGLTLAADPDFECRGAVMLHAFIAPGQAYTFDFPRGHEYGLYAASYTVATEDITALDAENDLYREYSVYGKKDSLTVENDSDSAIFAVYFIKKHLYEGTHAEHNVFESRRYIDISNRDAVREFARNTYENYASRLGKFFSGDNRRDGIIEAIFTDEPSFMGVYINAGLYPSVVHDKFDDTLILYPVVNWAKNIENRIMTEYGYDIKKYLIYLFACDTSSARKVRRQFYKATSDICEDSFFRQLSDVCADIKLPFSGHILLEDDIRDHPRFEGNFFSYLRHMHYPGIDMLQSLPETVYDMAFTPKLISSIARAYGRKHVMSEVSAHAQGGNVTSEQMLCSQLLQYAFGVDVFTSYYGENLLEPEQYALYNNAIGRTAALMTGRDTRQIAVYYPYETVCENCIPHIEGLSKDGDAVKRNAECHDTLYGITGALTDAQLDYDYIDFELLQNAEASDGVMSVRGNASYTVLIICASSVDDRLLYQLKRLKAAGVTVLYYEGENFKADASRLSGVASVINSKSSVIASAKRCATPHFELSKPSDKIAALCRETAYGKYILLVNSKNEERRLTAAVYRQTPFKLYMPFEDAYQEIEPHRIQDGYMAEIKIPPYGAVIIQ